MPQWLQKLEITSSGLQLDLLPQSSSDFIMANSPTLDISSSRIICLMFTGSIFLVFFWRLSAVISFLFRYVARELLSTSSVRSVGIHILYSAASASDARDFIFSSSSKQERSLIPSGISPRIFSIISPVVCGISVSNSISSHLLEYPSDSGCANPIFGCGLYP